MPKVMGIETEYGILSPGEADPEVLSAAVVRAWDGPATRHELDFPDAVPITDLHNRVLGNGARFYVDHAHPEYSSPEVANAVDAVLWDVAGESILLESARLASERLGAPVRVFKNNTDSQGSSYGCHENYLLARSTPWRRIVADFTGFLVSRSILVGAGRVGIGRHGEHPGFQLTQRADFFETTEGIETTRRRPLVNTRDEPHARPELWRRLHVITGDANRSPWTTWLKLGTAALVLDALEAGALPALRLTEPVAAFHAVSHDPSLRTLLELDDGRRLTALDLQRAYHEAVAAKAGRDQVAADSPTSVLLDAWGEVLDDLASDPDRLADRLDWVAKLQLLESYSARHLLPPDSPRFAQLDLAWAELGPRSPYEVMRRAGRFRPLPLAPTILTASSTPLSPSVLPPTPPSTSSLLSAAASPAPVDSPFSPSAPGSSVPLSSSSPPSPSSPPPFSLTAPSPPLPASPSGSPVEPALPPLAPGPALLPGSSSSSSPPPSSSPSSAVPLSPDQWEAAVRRAVAEPPSDTRAWLRGRIVQECPDAVMAASWDWLLLRNRRGRQLRVDLSDPLDSAADRLDAVLRALAG